MSTEADRQTRNWRRVLLGLSALVLALFALNLTRIQSWTGSMGVWGARSGIPYTERFVVTSAEPYLAYRAGLRTGDTLDVRLLSPAQRYRLIYRRRFGEALTLPIRRGGRLLRVTVVAVHTPTTLSWVLAVVGGIWTLLFALLLAWRRSDNLEARLLTLILLLILLSELLNPNSWVTPSLPLDVAVNALWAILSCGPVLLATYAATFAQPLSTTRKILTWSSYAVAAAAAAFNIVDIVAALTASPDPTSAWLWGGVDAGIPAQSLGIAFLALPVLCAIAAIRTTTGPARTRLVWTTALLGLFYAFHIAWNVLSGVLSSPTQLLLLLAVGNVSGFALPVGLSYSLFKRRLIDIGFVLNRAAVFSALSLIVVGAFVLLEWALGTWFEHTSHVASLAANAALALLLGVSLRFVHHRVDRFVDTVFFRKRHEDEEALRNFAHEAPYITDASTLISRTIAILELRTGADFATVTLCDELGPIDDNDPALVALRAWHKPLDLHGIDTALRGDVAYPMVARGQLVGALVLGPKRSGEAYAPDESAALGEIARSVASSLDVLESKQEPNVNQAVLAMLSSMQGMMLEIRDSIKAIGKVNA